MVNTGPKMISASQHNRKAGTANTLIGHRDCVVREGPVQVAPERIGGLI